MKLSFRSLIKPTDICIIIVYVLVFCIFLFMSLRNTGNTGSLTIQSDGIEYKYDISRPQEITFEGPVGETIIEITEDRKARFISSGCRDKICIRSGYIENNGDWVACLPNRIIAIMDSQLQEISNHNDEVDAVTY